MSPTPKTPLDPMIEAKRAKIATAERALDKLKIELATLETARHQIVSDQGADREPKGVANGGAAQRRGRSMSAGWKSVLIRIAKTNSNNGVDLDQISDFCVQEGIKILRPTLRAQMSNYVKRGYLGRTGEGKFFLSLAGLRAAGLYQMALDQTFSGASRKEAGASVLSDAPENAGTGGSSSG